MPLSIWIGVPLLGGLIGYLTNRIAVKMIFRPIRPVRILGIRVQGLIGRRQKDLSRSIGEVVGDHLVQHEDIVRCFEQADFQSLLTSVMDRALEPKIQDLRKLPLIGGLLSDERCDDIKRSVVQGVLKHKESFFEELERAIENGLDVEKIVTEKVAAFPVEQLERLVLRVASRELRAIEILGGLLGFLIGLGQTLLIWTLST